jgi:putative transcriptional regulator
MNYHYQESGLDSVWLEDGFTITDHPNYGELVSIEDVHGLHRAIGHWLIGQPRKLTGAEFRFLRVELDLSQRALGHILGSTEQAIAKWEKARKKPVANTAAERLLRVAYSRYIDGSAEFASILDRVTQLDAELAEIELHLTKNSAGSWAQAA